MQRGMNRRGHLVLISMPALILPASIALPPCHYLYSVSNQTRDIRTAREVFSHKFRPVPGDHDPVIYCKRFQIPKCRLKDRLVFENRVGLMLHRCAVNLMAAAAGFRRMLPTFGRCPMPHKYGMDSYFSKKSSSTTILVSLTFLRLESLVKNESALYIIPTAI
jgi:hypothetical protein